MQNGYAGHRLRLLGEAERGAVEGNTLHKARYVDADRNRHGHWSLCRLTSCCAAGPTMVENGTPLPARPHQLKLGFLVAKKRFRSKDRSTNNDYSEDSQCFLRNAQCL